MIRLLKLEFALLIRQASIWWIFIPLTLAMLVAAHLGAVRSAAQFDAMAQARAEEHHVEAIAADTARRLAQPSAPVVDFYRDPTGAYSYMTMFLVRYAGKEPYPLAPLAIGQSDVQPANLRMTFGFSTVFTDDHVNIGSPRALKLGGFDLAFVIVYLLPLALIAVSAPRLSFEQDSGIMRMISAQPAALGRVAAAKFGAVALFYLLWLLVAGVACLGMAGIFPLASGWAAALAWLSGAVALYGLLWIGVGALAVALWRGGRFAIGFAFAVWAVFAVLMPAAIALFIDARAAPVSRVAYIDASRQAVDHFYAEGPSVAKAWAASHPDLASHLDLAGKPEVMRMARDAYFKRVLAPYRQAFDRRQAEMTELERGLAFMSPTILLNRTMDIAAGGDMARHGRFLHQVDSFDQQVRGYFAPRIISALLSPPVKCTGCTAEFNFSDYTQVPRFVSASDPDQPTAAAQSAFGVMALFLIAIAAVFWIGFQRITRLVA